MALENCYSAARHFAGVFIEIDFAWNKAIGA